MNWHQRDVCQMSEEYSGTRNQASDLWQTSRRLQKIDKKCLHNSSARHQMIEFYQTSIRLQSIDVQQSTSSWHHLDIKTIIIMEDYIMIDKQSSWCNKGIFNLILSYFHSIELYKTRFSTTPIKSSQTWKITWNNPLLALVIRYLSNTVFMWPMLLYESVWKLSLAQAPQNIWGHPTFKPEKIRALPSLMALVGAKEPMKASLSQF